MRRAAAAVALVFFLAAPAFAAMSAPPSPRPPRPSGPREAVVQRVIDGDTFDTTEGEHVRLIGVDSPENQPHKSRIDAYGPEASRYTKKLLGGQKVRLEFDVEKKDKYGRTLAYVYLEDGRFVNLILVQEGVARAKYYKPNGLHYGEFRTAQKEAKKAGRGLWAEPLAKAA